MAMGEVTSQKTHGVVLSRSGIGLASGSLPLALFVWQRGPRSHCALQAMAVVETRPESGATRFAARLVARSALSIKMV